MSQALARYNALHESLRSRRRRPEVARGLDALAARVIVRTGSARASMGWLTSMVAQIEAQAPSVRATSDAALDAQLAEAREAFVRHRDTSEDLVRALALVREVARRASGQEAYGVQLLGALALCHGRVVEMLTGEGKTLTGSIAAVVLGWRHRHLHVFTVNDYLARRDAESRGSIYARCGLSVGAIQQEHGPAERFGIYARSIVYGTPKQITADWLRDQIRLGRVDSAWTGRSAMASAGVTMGPMVPGLSAALVDEADAVLIDEGVVPLIIAQSRRSDELATVYRSAASIARELVEGVHYSMDHLRRRAELTGRGREACASAFERSDEPIFRARRRGEELVRQALVARHCYRRGDQYQIVDGRVVIVDEYTGRFLPDRSWEHGLHQSVEAKEGVDVTADRETLARMSFQRFFRSYPFLAGMTGTAADATREIEEVYRRPVLVVPTHRPMVREQWPTRVLRTLPGKWQAIVESIEQVHAGGRPVLVGTRSIEASEQLSSRLASRGLVHRVLNAHHDEEEAELIAEAGRGDSGAGSGGGAAITVATNMAGRGTDIMLDEAARRAGGLHVLLTEMHTSKRIDRQFIGRAGRQGDPGSAQVFASLEDDLPRVYAGWWASRLKARALREELPRATPAWRLACALLRMAQRRAEARARRGRSSVLRQDDWIDRHLPGT